LLSASVLALSFVDPSRLGSSMSALPTGLLLLVGAMAALNKIGGTATIAKLPILAGSLILIATAIDVLSIAMVVLSKLDWQGIAKGLVAIGGLLVVVSAGAQLLKGSAVSLTVASVGL